MPVIKTSFKAAWWLHNPHLQTLWPTFFRTRPALDLQAERVELPDGDFIDLKWSTNPADKLVLLLHGLEGSMQSHYVPGLIQTLITHQYKVCFMQFRGCSGEPNRLPRSYHSGATEDLDAIVKHIRLQHQTNIDAMIGFSLGGNLLLKWLGEQGEKTGINKAIAVSVPFQLNDAAIRLKQGFSKFYQRHLITRLQNKYLEKFAAMASPLNLDVTKLSTFHDFDDKVTAPLHGFKNVDDYYGQCSSRQFLKHIHVPTLLLHDRTDPFMFPHTAPNLSELSASVSLELTENAGHVGFIEGKTPGCAHYWMDKRITDWLANSNQEASD